MANEIKVVMTLDDRDFTVKTVKAGETLKTLRGSVQGTHDAMKKAEGGIVSMGSKFKDFVFAISIARFALADLHDIVLALPIAVVKAGGEMERLTALMEGLSKETDVAARKLEAISGTRFVFDFARNAPFELKTITDMFVKLKTAGIDPTNGSMAALTNSLAKFGSSGDLAHRASIAIQQMAGKGVVSMEELRQQLGEAIPNAMQLMARGMGMTMAELAKAVSKGTVEATSAIKKMLIEMEIDSLGASKRMKETIPGMLETIKTEWELFKIEAANSGLGKVVKEQLGQLISFFRSTDGVKFAKDVGAGLTAAANFIVTLKDGLVALWPVIRTAGVAMLFYFGGQALKGAFGDLRQKFVDTKTAILDVQNAARAAAAEEARQIQAQIAANNQSVKLREQQINTTLKSERAAHLERVKAAATELNSAKEIAAVKNREAATATTRAGWLYAEAVKYENALRQLPAAHKAVSQAELDANVVRATNYRANMEAYRQETVALQSKAVAIRREADEHVRSAEAKFNAVRADRAYLDQAAAIERQLRSQMSAIRDNNVVLSRMAEAKSKVAQTATGAGTAILGFGKSIVSAIGWGFAVQGVLMLVSAAYDSIAGASRRAVESIERLQRIRSGEANRSDMEAQESALAAIKTQIDARKRQLDALQGRDKSTTDRRSIIQSEIEGLETQRRQIAQNLELAQGAVDRVESLEVASRQIGQLKSLTEDRLMASQAYADLQKINTELLKVDANSNKALYESLKKQQAEARNTYLREKLAIAAKTFEGELPKVKTLGARTLRAFESEYASFAQSIADQMITASDPNKFLTPSDDGFVNDRESPMLKMIQEQRAKLGQAKIEMDSLNRETASFVADAQNKAMFELLNDLAAGKFDFGTKKKPGDEPAKGARDQYIEQFAEFLNQGKGSALDFLGTLTTLDGAMQNSKQSLKSAFAEYITGAGTLNQAEAAHQALTAIKQKEASVTDELTAAQREFAAGVTFIPQSVEALSRELASMAEKAKLSGDALIEFDRKRQSMLSNKMQAELLKSELSSRKQLEDISLQSITNTQDRERQAHANALNRLNQEYIARKAFIVANGNDAKSLAALEADINNRRLAEQIRFTNASRTEVGRLAIAWQDVNGNIDKLMASSSQRWLDSIIDFVSGAEVSFKDLVTSFLKDLARIQLQAMFGPALEDGMRVVTNGIKSLLGIGTQDEGQKTANGLPLDPTGQSVLVTMLNGNQTIQTPVEAVNSVFSKIESSAVSLWETISGAMSTAFTFIKDALTSVINSVISAASSTGGASGIGSIFSAITSFFGFANGGIMSKFGPLKLNTYANGGIATGPQMAIFGEGRMNEAYVPLPDGRSIPVTMTGASRGNGDVTVNVINQTNQEVKATQHGPRFDGERMILDVVLSAASKPGTFRDGLRGAVGAR